MHCKSQYNPTAKCKQSSYHRGNAERSPAAAKSHDAMPILVPDADGSRAMRYVVPVVSVWRVVSEKYRVNASIPVELTRATSVSQVSD